MAVRKTDRELAESHRYKLPNGELAINVTAISGLMDDGKSSAFAYAAVKLAKEGLNFREEWNGKAERGTRIHGHLESFLKGQDIEQAEDEKGYVDALERFILDYDPETLELEGIVLSELGYGGRFDFIVRMPGPDNNWLIDAKSGRPYAIEHCLQLAAYRFADGIATYAEDGSLASLRPLPQIDHAGCLYLAEDGTYSLREYPADLLAFDAFCALLRAYQWSRRAEIKAMVKESKRPTTKEPEGE